MQKRVSHENKLITQESLSLHLPKKNTKNTNSTRCVGTTVKQETTKLVCHVWKTPEQRNKR